MQSEHRIKLSSGFIEHFFKTNSELKILPCVKLKDISFESYSPVLCQIPKTAKFDGEWGFNDTSEMVKTADFQKLSGTHEKYHIFYSKWKLFVLMLSTARILKRSYWSVEISPLVVLLVDPVQLEVGGLPLKGTLGFDGPICATNIVQVLSLLYHFTALLVRGSRHCAV